MSFKYSYRSFLITSLLTGILVLLLFSIKLSNVAVEIEEDTYDMVVIPDEVLEEEKVIEEPFEKVKIETNRAYNEAEKFIASVENENREITETTEGKLQEMAQAIEDSKKSADESQVSEIIKKEEKKKTVFSNSDSNKDQQAIVEGGNRNTTISYRLVDRKDIYIPNPVYTCYGSGRVVINVEVGSLGEVNKGTYNKSASTTTNQCLIEAAIEYALQSRFSKDPSREKQLGTITFNFPGQN